MTGDAALLTLFDPVVTGFFGGITFFFFLVFVCVGVLNEKKRKVGSDFVLFVQKKRDEKRRLRTSTKTTSTLKRKRKKE